MMKCGTSILVIIISFCTSSVTLSQLSDNFEFLDHSDVQTRLSDFILIGDQVFYVEQNLRHAQTKVKLINSKGELKEVLDQAVDFLSKVKICQQSNDHFNVFIYDLSNSPGDHFTTNVYRISYNQGVITNEIIVIPSNGSLETSTSVVVDSLNRMYVTTSLGFIYSVKDGVVELEMDNIDGILYSNANDDIYLIQNSDLGTILHFDGQGFKLHKTFEGSVIDIDNKGDSNLVLIDNELFVYDLQFEKQLYSFILPKEVKRLSQIEIVDSSIYFLVNSTESNQIHRITQDSIVTKIYESVSPNEFLTSFKILPNNRILVTGQYSVSDINDNLFFRNVSPGEETQYEKVSLAIEQFTIFDSGTSLPQQPFAFIYYADLEIKNESEKATNNLSLYGNKHSYHINAGNFSYFSSLELLPNESRRDSAEFIIFPIKPDTMKVFLPGADYKFNVSEFRLRNADITSDVSNIESFFSLKIYPNPTKDFLRIDFDKEISAYTIYNKIGQKVTSGNELEGYQIDVSKLTPGVYFLNIMNDQQKSYALINFVKL